jgi:hypothetical protein
MIKITGFDELQKELTDAQKILSEIDGDLGQVTFDPEDPSSIEQAIQLMEKIVDDKVSGYEDNSIVGPLAEEMKDGFRKEILESAAASRLNSEE